MEENKKNGLEIKLSKEHNHLVFTETEFDDIGIQTSQKRAILQIDSVNYDPEDILAKAQTLQWEIYGEQDPNGFYKARRVAQSKAEK